MAQNKQAFKEVTNEIELFKHDSTKTQIYYNKALKAYNNNQHELSGNYFTKAYQYNAGKNSIYLLNASIAYFKAEKYSKIITCYETLSKKNTYQSDFEIPLDNYKQFIQVYIEENRNEEALLITKIALSKFPKDLDLLKLKSNLLYTTGNTKAFSESLKDLIKQDYNKVNSYFNLGVISQEKGNFKQAKKHYKKALKIDKNNEQTNFNLGTLFVLEGNQIISEMNNLGMSKKDDRRYKHLKKRKNKLIKFAVSYFEKVLQKNKNNEDAINALLIINNNPGYK